MVGTNPILYYPAAGIGNQYIDQQSTYANMQSAQTNEMNPIPELTV